MCPYFHHKSNETWTFYRDNLTIAPIRKDERHPWVGRKTKIIGKHGLKNYEIIIKSVNHDEQECVVEVQATMRREQIPVKNIDLR